MDQSDAACRKHRSEEILRREGVPFIDHLPFIESEAEVTLRSVEEAANRALTLCLVALKGEGLAQERVDQVLRFFGAEPHLSPQERAFVQNTTDYEKDRPTFSWRYEGLWVLLWALGFIDELGRPDRLCDVPRSVGIPIELGRKQFIERAGLRSVAEILDVTDLTFRYHWATTEARLHGHLPTANLDPGVVYERHYALNWLIRHMDDEWDDVRTDT
jgi:hypothetical protein